MSFKIADNIISPLGETTEANYQAVLDGQSTLRKYSGHWDVPEPFVASLFTEAQWGQIFCPGFSAFESLIFRSASQAVLQAESVDSGFDVSGPRTVLVVSTTKGNVGLLTEENRHDGRLFIGASAEKVAQALHFSTQPIVVCNACISGLSALITANRLLDSGQYDYAVVCGADVQNAFIVSGFQAFKALSPEECRPFDIERLGLNLGEAAATIILSRRPVRSENPVWEIGKGCVANDAYHISAPAKNGDGLLLALQRTVEDTQAEEWAFVNAHGTGTLFNDQMEARAIARSGLSAVPVNALKGYFGHTMGAAGILETLVSMYALQDGLVLGTRGFEETGVSEQLSLSSGTTETIRRKFVKMLSGFGGCNAVVCCEMKGAEQGKEYPDVSGMVTEIESFRSMEVEETHTVRLTPSELRVDGILWEEPAEADQWLVTLYKKYVRDYPKFYKMDGLSRLGFVAAELLLQAEGGERFMDNDRRGVVLFNHSSSVDTDVKYLRTIRFPENYFPSPSLFVYTLPNIVTGEIAIRNRYHGETCFYILPRRDGKLMDEIGKLTLCSQKLDSILTGWIDYEDENCYAVEMKILKTKISQ